MSCFVIIIIMMYFIYLPAPPYIWVWLNSKVVQYNLLVVTLEPAVRLVEVLCCCIRAILLMDCCIVAVELEVDVEPIWFVEGRRLAARRHFAVLTSER